MTSGHAAPYVYVDDLWIVTPYFNPHRYRTKLHNYERFMAQIRGSGLRALVVECAFADAAFELQPSPHVLQLRANDVLWQKERLLNVAIEQLPRSCAKVAWLDCDIIFRNPEWAVRTSELLDRCPVVQPFTTAVRLPKDRLFSTERDTFFTSFCARRQQAQERSNHRVALTPASSGFGSRAAASEIAYCVACGSRTMTVHDCACAIDAPPVIDADPTDPAPSRDAPTGEFRKHGHTGFGWAARRDLLLDPGLYDAGLSGTGDHLMAHAMCGDWSSPCLPRLVGGSRKHLDYFTAWGQRMFHRVGGHVGCVAGQIDHLWHGDDAHRDYKRRGWELAEFDFDPAVDLRIGGNGCWEWNSDKPALHRWSATYFGLRREDG